MPVKREIKRPIERRRLVKGLVVGLLLATAIVWVRSYALLIPLAICVWTYISTYAFTLLTSWVESKTPISKTLLSWGMAVLFGIGSVAYVITFVMSIAKISSPDNEDGMYVIDKLRYGVARDTSNVATYYRTHKLGMISRGDMALIHTPQGLLAQKIVALPNDTVTISDGSLYINGLPSDNSPRPTATYKLRPHTTYSVTRQMHETMAEMLNDGIPQPTDTSSMRLPISRRERDWKPYTYATILHNMPDDRIFPHNAAYPWNAYHWGPIRLPKRGDSIPLTYANVMLYGPLVKQHEGTTLKPLKNASYTFKLSYYMSLNNNRDIIADSRQYGPIPEYHILSHIIKL